MHEGARGSNAVYACLQVSTNTKLEMEIFPRKAVEEMEDVAGKGASRDYPYIYRDERC